MSFKQRYLDKQRDLSFANITPPFPKIVKIDICNVCNYNCIFCSQSKQNGKKGNIDRALCLKIIKDSFEAGAKELCLSMTGEPLLNPDLECFIEYAKRIVVRCQEIVQNKMRFSRINRQVIVGSAH